MWRRAAAAAAAVAALTALVVLACLPGEIASKNAPEHAPARRLLLGAGVLLPSTYLNYEAPRGNKKSWFSTFQKTSSGPETFFAVQRTQFGYLGIQRTETFGGRVKSWTQVMSPSDEDYYGLVIFSIWNTGASNCVVEETGEGAAPSTFSGEGTGCQIKFPTYWTTDPYSFMTTTEELPSGRLKISGYWFESRDSNPDLAMHWKLVGVISIGQEGRRFGEGGISAFIEQFLAVGSAELRMASYGPQFMELGDGRWTPIEAATFRTTRTTHPSVYTIGRVKPNGDQFQMGVSGANTGIGQNTQEGARLVLRNPGTPESSPQLQAFIRLRESGRLPAGCAGNVNCGGGGWLPSPINIFPSLPGNNPLLSLFFGLVVTGFVVSGIATLFLMFRQFFPQHSAYRPF